MTGGELESRALIVAYNYIRTGAQAIAHAANDNADVWHEETLAVNDRAVAILEEMAKSASTRAALHR